MLNQEEIKSILTEINKAVQKHLKEDVIYYCTPIKTEKGIIEREVFFFDETNQKIMYGDDLIMKINQIVSKLPKNFENIIKSQATFLMLEFKLEKGKDIEMKVFTPEMLLKEIKRELIVDGKKHNLDEAFQKGWQKIDFSLKKDKLQKTSTYSLQTTRRLITNDEECFDTEDYTEILFYALDQSIKTLVVSFDKNNAIFQSEPPFEEHGLPAIENFEMPVSNEKEEKILTMLKEINEGLQPHLKEGVTYYSTPMRDKYGTSNWSIFVFDENEEKDHAKAQEINEEIDKLDYQFNDIVSFYKPFTIVEFKIAKGSIIEMKAFTPEMLLKEIKRILKVEILQLKEGGVFEKGWLKIDFFIQAKGLSKKVLHSIQTNQNLQTREMEMFGLADITNVLFYALEEDIKSLQIVYDENDFNLQSEPVFENYALKVIEDINIPQEKAFEKRVKEQQEVEKMRQGFYNSLGKVYEEAIYFDVDGFNAARWPGSKSAYYTERARVIYTDKTTILITEGLTDLYNDSSKDPENKYNGLGAEFYVEFDGIHEFNIIKDHFLVAVMNSLIQVAIKHGDFIDSFIKRHGTTTVQFNVQDIDLYCVRGEEVENQSIEDFFLKKHYAKKKKFGVLLSMPSKIIPEKMSLTREEVLLIGIKPFGQIWIAREKLLSKDDEVVKQTREKMIKSFQTIRGGRTPITYHK